MIITINKEKKEVPFDLALIPLERFISYYDQHGRMLDKRLEDILTKDYRKQLTEQGFPDITDDDVELHRHIEADKHMDNEAIAWCTFWTGYDFEQIRDLPAIQPVLDYYRLLKFLLKESEDEQKDFTAPITWNGDEWEIHDFKVNPASEMTFNEVITSKEVMRQVHAIGKGKWDVLPYLCAIFLRKKGESFTDSFVHEGSERLALMKTLPMDFALRVAFFLSACVITYSKSSAFSESLAGPASLN